MRDALRHLLDVKTSSLLFMETRAIRTGHRSLSHARSQNTPVDMVIYPQEGNPIVEMKHPIDMGADEEFLLSERAVPQRLTVS